MSNKTIIFIAVFSLLTLTSVFFVLKQYRLNNFLLDQNIEALATGDHYAIQPCFVEGWGQIYQCTNFCADFTTPWVIGDCNEYYGQAGVPMRTYECVSYVDDLWRPWSDFLYPF